MVKLSHFPVSDPTLLSLDVDHAWGEMEIVANHRAVVLSLAWLSDGTMVRWLGG